MKLLGRILFVVFFGFGIYAFVERQMIMMFGFFLAAFAMIVSADAIRSLAASLRETEQRDDALLSSWPQRRKDPKSEGEAKLLH